MTVSASETLNDDNILIAILQKEGISSWKPVLCLVPISVARFSRDVVDNTTDMRWPLTALTNQNHTSRSDYNANHRLRRQISSIHLEDNDKVHWLVQRQRLSPCQSLPNESKESFRLGGCHGPSNSFQRQRKDRFDCLIRNLRFG
jgi:hypothetical protein